MSLFISITFPNSVDICITSVLTAFPPAEDGTLRKKFGSATGRASSLQISSQVEELYTEIFSEYVNSF